MSSISLDRSSKTVNQGDTLPGLKRSPPSGDGSSRSTQGSDFKAVLEAATQYGIPSVHIGHVGIGEGKNEALVLGSGMTAQVVQHVTDDTTEMVVPPNSTVALKIFRLRRSDGQSARTARQNVYDNILREIKAFCHSSFSGHPNIVRLLFVGWRMDDPLPVLAMELGTHGSLDHVIKESGPGLSNSQKQHVTVDIALGLFAIHHAGFLHGDLKPDNIIILGHSDPDRQVIAKLTDFGGSLQATDQATGKPVHMTPLCAEKDATLRGYDRLSADASQPLRWLTGTTSFTYLAIVIRQLELELRELDESIEYVPITDDIPDQFPEGLSSVDFVRVLKKFMLRALSGGSKDVAAKGHVSYGLGLVKLLEPGLSLDREKGIEYMRAGALHGNGPAIFDATLMLEGTHLESNYPVRFYLTLLAFSHSNRAMQILSVRWPSLWNIIRKFIREMSFAYVQAGGEVSPGSNDFLASRFALYLRHRQPLERQLTLHESLTFGAVEEVEKALNGSILVSDWDETLPGLLHKLSFLPDAEASSFARVAYEKGARLDFFAPSESPIMEGGKGLGHLQASCSPLSSAIRRGKPTLALAIFCIHIEFDAPIPDLFRALQLSFALLYHEISEILLQLLYQNPEMCQNGPNNSTAMGVNLHQIMSVTPSSTKITDAELERRALHGGQYDSAYAKTLQVILAEGFDPTEGSIDTCPLFLAFRHDDVVGARTYVQHIQSRGLDVVARLNNPGNTSERNDITALSMCIFYGSLRCFEFLLKEYPQLLTMNDQVSDTGILQEACSDQTDTRFISLLLEAGCDVITGDRVHSASSNGHVEIVKLLISQGFDVDACSDATQFPPELNTAEGFTALDLISLLTARPAMPINIRQGPLHGIKEWIADMEEIKSLLAAKTKHSKASRVEKLYCYLKRVDELMLNGGIDKIHEVLRLDDTRRVKFNDFNTQLLSREPPSWPVPVPSHQNDSPTESALPPLDSQDAAEFWTRMVSGTERHQRRNNTGKKEEQVNAGFLQQNRRTARERKQRWRLPPDWDFIGFIKIKEDYGQWRTLFQDCKSGDLTFQKPELYRGEKVALSTSRSLPPALPQRTPTLRLRETEDCVIETHTSLDWHKIQKLIQPLRIFGMKTRRIPAESALDYVDDKGNTPLHIYARLGVTEGLKAFIQAISDIECENNSGLTALQVAVACNRLEVVRILLDHGAQSERLDATTGLLPLHISTLNRAPDVARLLLKAGANPDGESVEGIPVIHFCLSNCDSAEMVQVLIDGGADVNLLVGTDTPLSLAVANSREDSLKALLSAGAAMNATRDPEDDESLLHIAAQEGSMGIAEILLDHGADINRRDRSLKTPIIDAILCGQRDMIQFFCSRGVDPSVIPEFQFFRRTREDKIEQLFIHVGDGERVSPERLEEGEGDQYGGWEEWEPVTVTEAEQGTTE
ncbi:hypothetical protein SLS54_000020 [Diplodia seriata]